MPDAGRRVLLIGGSVGDSLSEPLQNAGFEAAGLDCRYQPTNVARDRLAAFIEEVRRDAGVLGANVTIPHKEAVVALLDELDATAAASGAVNTISRTGPRLKGWNTDGVGFSHALAELGFDARGKVALIIGAGGAARAVAMALRPVTDRLLVANRTPGRAEALCRELGLTGGGPIQLEDLDGALATASLVVNATPVDLSGAASIAPPRLYFDLRSRRSITGRLMLLHQGIAAFQIWTGRPAPAGAMRAALTRAAEGAIA